MVSNLKRHHTSSFHRNNVNRLLGRSAAVHAPPKSQFLRVWDELQKGVAPHSVGVDNMKAAKIYQMIFCLSEALYAMDREFAKKATVSSIRRDESNGRLLLYFSLVTKDLQGRSGVLGVRKGFGTGASAITSATWDLVQRFATPCYAVSKFSPPKKAKVAQLPQMDQPLVDHFAKIQRQMIIDAAADEQLSVQQMMEQTKPGSKDRLFANLKLVTHDHSHATSRILKRGFYSIPALKAILKEDIQSKMSICQMVDNSKVLKDHFRSLNSQSEGPASQDISSLGAAKHRFASLQRPLMRSVLRFDTLFLTAGFIYHSRKSTSKGKAAHTYLAAQSTERLLLKAMMADAAEETMALLRFGDQNFVDVSMLPREIGVWHSRCSRLFDAEECKHHGFTQFMLDALQKPRIVPVTGQTIGCSAGVPDQVFRSCLGHLKEWLVVAREICRAEFPNFRLLAAFQIFDIDVTNPLGHAGNTSRASMVEVKKRFHDYVDILAKFFSVNAKNLHDELDTVKPMAVEEMTDSGCTCQEAWRRVLKTRLKTFQTLHKVLLEYMALGASTTVVERGFGKTRKDISTQQRHVSECKENALTKILLDRPLDSDMEPVLQQARAIWGQWFGIPRASSKARRHSKKRRLDADGVDPKKRKVDPKMSSEAAFLRCRRNSIDKLMAKDPAERVAKQKPVEVGHEASKEIAFQGEKRVAKMIEAYQQGILPQKFVTGAFLKKVRKFHKKKQENDKKRITQESKVKELLHSKVQGLSKIKVRELKVHVDVAVGKDPKVLQWLQRCGIKPASERVNAGFFVVQDPNSCSQRTRLVALLKGGYMATPQSCTPDGLKGPLVPLGPELGPLPEDKAENQETGEVPVDPEADMASSSEETELPSAETLPLFVGVSQAHSPDECGKTEDKPEAPSPAGTSDEEPSPVEIADPSTEVLPMAEADDAPGDMVSDSDSDYYRPGPNEDPLWAKRQEILNKLKGLA
eukprot:s17_g29.t1